MSQSGFFISFEGSEGCGKSTQIRLLAGALDDPLLVREPGGTGAGEVIRHLLQHAPEGRSLVPEAELLLFAASRAQLVREIILPALEAGRTVISDRFLDSTTVYQGVARKIPIESLAPVNRLAAGPRLPDVTFLLDMDSDLAMQRLRTGRGSSAPFDRMEEECREFYEAVRNGYLALAASEPVRFCVLDASEPVEALARSIKQTLISRNHALFQGLSA